MRRFCAFGVGVGPKDLVLEALIKLNHLKSKLSHYHLGKASKIQNLLSG
jgi:hypothetical protein